jgi:hypothetical protein
MDFDTLVPLLNCEVDTKEILNNYDVPAYVDSDIIGKFQRKDFDELFRKINSFTPTNYHERSINISDEIIVGKSWTDGVSNLDYISIKESDLLHDDDDFLICYKTADKFAIILNAQGHPAVLTNKFAFYISDGSTDSNFDTNDVNLQNIKSLFKEKMLEYLFELY